ncbi:MAG: short-chain dehydrogenase [Chlamydia sp. 32-24]|nr:MAG: short-chain dehydrogenase [Chlamydia sp. 32-24]
MKILITGVSKGIGLASAKHFLNLGHEVIGISRTVPTWQHEKFTHYSIDLKDLKNLPFHLKQIVKEQSNVDWIVVNAGIGQFGNLEQMSFDAINAVIQTNLLSPIYITKAFLPLFKTKGKGGFIFIGSEASLHGKRQGTIYCASKFGLRGFVQSLRDECCNTALKVTLINPGMVDTNFFNELSFQPGEESNQRLETSDIVNTLWMIIEAREGCHFDEINLSPQNKKIVFK